MALFSSILILMTVRESGSSGSVISTSSSMVSTGRSNRQPGANDDSENEESDTDEESDDDQEEIIAVNWNIRDVDRVHVGRYNLLLMYTIAI